MELREAPTVASYFADPVGRYLSRRRFFCSSPGGGLYALFARGSLEVADLAELDELVRAAARSSRPRRQLVVLRDVQHVSAAALASFARWWERPTPYFSTIAREAVVRPDGVVGMLAEGFYRVVPERYCGRVFRELDAALEWLGDHGAGVASWLAAAAALARRMSGASELVPHLQTLAVSHGATLTVGDAARALGVSTRGLQRALAAEGQTFVRLRAAALSRRAEELLAGTDVSVKEIAATLGYRSSARFAEVFRGETGLNPKRWREVSRRRIDRACGDGDGGS